MSMSSSQPRVIVLGAGPSGLAAADELSRTGAQVIVAERSSHTGGLMASIPRGDFVFDIGRKELPPRFPEVHALWEELIGEDYRAYDHRVGVLTSGRIVEDAPLLRGRFRGMSRGGAARVLASYLASRLRPGCRTIQTMEDYYVRRYGRAYYRTFLEVYNTRFLGRSPRELQPPLAAARPRLVTDLRKLAARAQRSGPEGTWRHPAKGTGQLAAALEKRARAGGTTFMLNTTVLSIQCGEDHEVTVALNVDGCMQELHGDYVISSLPLHALLSVLRCPLPPDLRAEMPNDPFLRRAVALVYLISPAPPAVPHFSLLVNDPTLRATRMVNYAALNGSMVPPGQTGVCVEYFCDPDANLLRESDDGLVALARAEAQRAHTIDAARVTDAFVVRIPSVQMFTYWQTSWARRAGEHLRTVQRIYDVHRPGIDRAALAGIDAARACLANCPMLGRSQDPLPEDHAL